MIDDIRQKEARIVRRLEAKPERVYRAWTDATEVRQWFKGSPNTTVSSAELDVRVGGAYRITVVSDDEYIVHGTYLRLEPPRLIEFTWKWVDSVMEPEETLVRVEFTAVPDGTEMVLTHTRFSNERSFEAHGYGWNQVLATLSDHVKDPSQ